jgi:hypothetical protein
MPLHLEKLSFMSIPSRWINAPELKELWLISLCGYMFSSIKDASHNNHTPDVHEMVTLYAEF